MPSNALTPADGLAQLSFIVQRILEDCTAAEGLSVIQGRMLGILRDRTPPISELGARLGLDKSSISGLVDRAEKRGLVERGRSSSDGRSVHVKLTEEGRARVQTGEAAFETAIGKLLSHLPVDDQATLARIVSTMLVAVAGASGVDIRSSLPSNDG